MEKYGNVGQATITIWRMRLAGWVRKATDTHTHSTVCNIYCSSTVTMVARTRLSLLRLYVRCLSLSKRSNGPIRSCSAHDVTRPKTKVEGFRYVVRSCVSVGGRAGHLLGPHEVTDLGQGNKRPYRVIDLPNFV